MAGLKEAIASVRAKKRKAQDKERAAMDARKEAQDTFVADWENTLGGLLEIPVNKEKGADIYIDPIHGSIEKGSKLSALIVKENADAPPTFCRVESAGTVAISGAKYSLTGEKGNPYRVNGVEVAADGLAEAVAEKFA